MANWCSNNVEFKGEQSNIESLVKELRGLEVENFQTGLGVRPSNEGSLAYMFNLYVEDNFFSFESRWSPANDSLKFLAKKHNVTITNDYSECGNMVFGRWIGDRDTELDVWLTDEEWDLAVPGDEDFMFYTYDGKEYESQDEALEIILNRKIEGLQNVK